MCVCVSSFSYLICLFLQLGDKCLAQEQFPTEYSFLLLLRQGFFKASTDSNWPSSTFVSSAPLYLCLSFYYFCFRYFPTLSPWWLFSNICMSTLNNAPLIILGTSIIQKIMVPYCLTNNFHWSQLNTSNKRLLKKKNILIGCWILFDCTM